MPITIFTFICFCSLRDSCHVLDMHALKKNGNEDSAKQLIFEWQVGLNLFLYTHQSSRLIATQFIKQLCNRAIKKILHLENVSWFLDIFFQYLEVQDSGLGIFELVHQLLRQLSSILLLYCLLCMCVPFDSCFTFTSLLGGTTSVNDITGFKRCPEKIRAGDRPPRNYNLRAEKL